MATYTEDWRGVVIELDHDETQKLLSVLRGTGDKDAIARFLGTLGIAAAATPWVALALAVHIAWEVIAIEASDKGDGVILTMPYFMPGVLIPSARHVPDIPNDWAERTAGTFVSVGGDQVEWLIEHGAAPAGTVVFRMANRTQSGWDKILVLRDGLGGQWEIKGTRNHAGENALWTEQCQNGQQLTFRKQSFIGIWIDVFSIGGLNPLQDRDRVTFSWTKD